MIFLGGKVFGFGKLSDLALDFREGINLVFAPNEGGKSTLQHFLIGLLYGQLRPDLKTQRRLDPWADHYKPWYGGQYGGVLHCRTADGRDLEIRRFFGREESRLEIRTSTGEDITRLYGQQRNGEVLFGKHHFGLPKDLYESLGVIRENRAAELGSRATIRDRIANLAHCGHEDLSIRKSLDRLAETLESIGSERAPTKPYKQAIDLVRALAGAAPAVLAAITALATGDPTAVSGNRIAKEIGATWGVVKYQFGDVDGLWAAVLRHTAEQRGDLPAIASPGGTLRERVTALIELLHDLDPGRPGSTVGVIPSVTRPFCGDCDRVRLTADGQPTDDPQDVVSRGGTLMPIGGARKG